MGKKPVYLMVLVIVLMGILGVSTDVHKVEAPYPRICICADGSINPPTTNITSSDNITYTFTADINAEIVVSRDNIVIDGAGYTLEGAGSGFDGISVGFASNVTIKNMEIRTFTTGIDVNDSDNIYISGNNLTNCSFGITLFNSSNNTISGNTIYGTMFAIGIDFVIVTNNTVFGNTITNFVWGMRLYNNSDYNTIFGNTITDNQYGFHLENSFDNAIYHNNLIDNANQTHFATPVQFNIWDKGYPFGGNYWSDYAGVDLNRDGIGDSWYNITQDNTDRYPLMGMFHSFNASLGYYVNVISNSTIDDFEYFESNSTIRMYVSNMTLSQTYGFCRVCIPKGLMSPPYTVIIDDEMTEVLYFNGTVYDNGTHRWVYFAYEHSIHKVDIIPEFPTWTSMLLILILLTVAIAIYKRRLLKTPIH